MKSETVRKDEERVQDRGCKIVANLCRVQHFAVTIA